jgi:SAM-dependent methyltransferase
MARFLHEHRGQGADHVPFEEVVLRYGDLAVGAERGPADADRALAALLLRCAPEDAALGVDVGCGVGRGAFALREHVEMALGLDRSLSRVRRARNVASTEGAFLLPSGGGGREAPMRLEALARAGTDFATAEPDALPVADGAAHVAVWRSGDGAGPWPSPETARAEAVRVLAPGGLLLTEEAAAPAGFVAADAEPPLHAWTRT